MSTRLERAFEFEETDILLNQSGQLSEKQVKLLSEYKRINRFGARLPFIMMFLSMTLLGGISFYSIGIDHLKKHPEEVYSFMAVFSIMWLLYTLSLIWGKLRSDVKSGKLSSIEGFAERNIKKVRQWTAYYVTVGKVKFQVSTRAQYNAFKPEVHYRIHYIEYPPTQIILSVSDK